MADGADEVIGHVSAIAADAADELGHLALLTDYSRIAAASEADEHFLGTKRVSPAVDPGGLTDDEWDVLRRMAGLRMIGQLRAVMARQGRELAVQLHRGHGITGQRLAEALGVSNATASSWIRESKAREEGLPPARTITEHEENHG